MSTEKEELIAEGDAARYLGVYPKHLREFATERRIRLVMVQRTEGVEPMYLWGEILHLKEILRSYGSKWYTEEWPDIIDG
jgi:hypothetical protein